jgi:Protein of unknown function (DUF4012)
MDRESGVAGIGVVGWGKGEFVRRVWWLLLGLVVLSGGALVAWQASSEAAGVRADLLASQRLLGRAGALAGGPVSTRLELVEQARGRAGAARATLDRWPLRPLATVPWLGRDVRVARTIADASGQVVGATGDVAVAFEPLHGGHPTGSRIGRASAALLALSDVLGQTIDRVRAAKPLVVARGPRGRFLAEAQQARRAAFASGQGLRMAAGLYGPAGSARYFLAFQNPAELRGTGGLIGQYGIVESGPHGPRLTRVEPYDALDRRTTAGVPLPVEVARRYGRFSIGRAWSAVNIPPDLPTVAQIVLPHYRQATGTRVDGVIAVDPLAVAEILRVSGPITVDGMRLDAANVASQTLVDAYRRYADDNQARRAFLAKVAGAAFAAFQGSLATRPEELVRGLAVAARGLHVQVYSSDPAIERAMVELGVSGSAAAPRDGDYLMPVSVNTGGNKVDAFLQRTVRYRVSLQPDGGAKTTASITLRNGAPARGLSRYVIGPFDHRFRAGENSQFQTLYVAGAYGFTRATRDGRPVSAEGQADLGAMAISQAVAIPPGRSVTLAYDLERTGAMRITGGHADYQLMVRPQASVQPDQLELSLQAPAGWGFASVPAGFRRQAGVVSWSGALDRTRTFRITLVRSD